MEYPSIIAATRATRVSETANQQTEREPGRTAWHLRALLAGVRAFVRPQQQRQAMCVQEVFGDVGPEQATEGERERERDRERERERERKQPNACQLPSIGRVEGTYTAQPRWPFSTRPFFSCGSDQSVSSTISAAKQTATIRINPDSRARELVGIASRVYIGDL